MKLSAQKRIAAVLGLWLVPVLANAGPAPVTLAAGLEQIPLAGYIEVLRDDTGGLTFDEVRSPFIAQRFQSTDADFFNQGWDVPPHWYRFALRNPPSAAAAGSGWVLEMGIATIDELDVYLFRSSGSVTAIQTGDRRLTPSGLLSHRDFAVPFQLAPGEELTVYVRARNGASLIFFPSLWADSEFHRRATRENLLFGAYFGILLIMALYNLSIYAWIRDHAYLYYVLYITSTAYLSAVLFGYARLYGNGLFDDAPRWISSSYPYSIHLTDLFVVLFAREFLQLRQIAPRLNLLMIAGAVLAAINLIMTAFVHYGLAVRLGAVTTAALSVLTLVVGVYLAVKGSRAALFYVVAWAYLLASVAFSVLLVLTGKAGPLSAVAWPTGVCIAAALLSLALADRIATERRERERFARLKQYLPQKVADLVVEGSGKALLEPRRRQVTVCVIDLRGFTPFSETAAPEDVMNVLREFFSTMGDIVEKHGGTVEHFAGDSMLIFFNAPLEIPNPELQGVQTALEMRAAFEPLRARWSKHGHKLGLGIGIADGYATIGAIGFSGRSQYAAIGAVTNLASRLCSSAQHGEILTTSRVLAAVGSMVQAESVGEQTIKGFHRPIEVARVTGLQAA